VATASTNANPGAKAWAGTAKHLRSQTEARGGDELVMA
jgi:hypothetical protein